MSDSVRLHRWQPTRLPRPWDSPGKNTGVGCHFLLQCTKVKSESEIAQSWPALSDPMDHPWESPGRSTGVGATVIVQATAPTPVPLPGKSHERRSLVGCSPWGCEESDTTERLHFHALEREMATHSSVLAWRIPGTGEPTGLPSMGSHRVGHD